ncbi:MAG: methyltransferase domain-containing protein [Merismopedia sp. SIO2A8]|nr:methyltransferase domain-containing protein [Symploca sp. SIO2B6]NET48966.1 methyltransferase domain-containing protein [Merismopedia sp. SIO2A8]
MGTEPLAIAQTLVLPLSTAPSTTPSTTSLTPEQSRAWVAASEVKIAASFRAGANGQKERTQKEKSRYDYRDRPSSDGIGKVYMGREIAQVMGHRGAAWLERPSRIQEEKPHLLVADLDISPTDVIADIGAGTGYLTVRLASNVPNGKVLAVDVQPEMLQILGSRVDDAHFDNVELILADEDNPHLPQETVDMAIMLDVYHELEYPFEVMQSVVAALQPGGKVVLVEYRGENPLIPIKRLHKMTERQIRQELQAVGLTWVSTQEDLPRQHLMVFEKAI